ncbi:DUF6884 domain-containing protein [Caldivirga sp. UBA161]|uniref:DUF6884 domain-containing protein n=1 Tax=Caldivirga sp. UBA161 TaxID=1915569 RepID=UPI0025B90669|nr:DUF6884 domain-containing protein [Caldivirga sp. UBA161]
MLNHNVGALIYCSARKRINVPNPPGFDLDDEDKYKLSLPSLPAFEMYTGLEFTKTIQYLNLKPNSTFILSARYGLIRGDQVIIPYEAKITLSNYRTVVDGWVRSVNGNGGIRHFINSRFNLLVVRLSESYMMAMDYLVGKLGINPCIGERIIVYSPIMGPFNTCPNTELIRVKGQGDYIKRIKNLR